MSCREGCLPGTTRASASLFSSASSIFFNHIDCRKKLEHTFKAIIHDGDTVSVHRPDFYAKRFMNFMSTKIFKKIPSLDLPEVKGSHRKFRTVVASLIALKHSPS